MAGRWAKQFKQKKIKLLEKKSLPDLMLYSGMLTYDTVKGYVESNIDNIGAAAFPAQLHDDHCLGCFFDA